MTEGGTSSTELLIGEVVLTAAGLSGAEREAYLESVEASEAELAARVRRRLAAAEDLSGSFLEIPAVARLAGDRGTPEAPVRGTVMPSADRYELREALGAGGMGRVVLAFDRQLGRAVALKLLHRDDSALTRLLLREARAQARVQHEHVLEIYDSGELDGQPFIAMRYVAGGTLAEIAPSLSTEQRVRLLAQVARGLHAAHREGLLHRDVKPSNVLVEHTADNSLRALVGDFGLAAELGDERSTMEGAVAGSPPYIAPERLAGPAAVDRRSDVYSLGATMYHVLTGQLPVAGTNTIEVLRRAARGEVIPPRLRLPTLPAELEAVILRCLARDPDQRYASARAVAMELERYLDGEVVEAYAAGLAYRLTRFLLRNKLLAGMAAAAAVAVLIAAVAVGVFAVRADAARRSAETRQGQAEDLIHFMVVDLRDKLESLGRLDVLSDVGDAAMAYFAAVPETELSSAELARRSRALYQVGEVRIRLGDLAGAATPLEESLSLARRLAEISPRDPERLFELGQSYFWLGFVHWERGDLAAAREPFENYLEVSQRLVSLEPGRPAWRRELAYAHSNLGSLLQAEGDLEAALGQFRATLAIERALVAAEPADTEMRSEMAATLNTIGVALQDLGRLAEAGEYLAADLRIRRRLLAEEPSDPRLRELLGTSHGYLGIHRFIRGELAAAKEAFESKREIFAELVAHDPANTAWRYSYLWSLLDLGRVAYALGDEEAAARHWEGAQRGIEELFDLDPTPHRWRRTLATALYHRAIAQRSRSVPEARGTALAAVELLAELAEERTADHQVRRWLSWSYLLLGILETSPPAKAEAFTRAEEAIEPLARDLRDGRALAPWAEALRCLGRLEEARRADERLRALGFAEPSLGVHCRPTR